MHALSTTHDQHIRIAELQNAWQQGQQHSEFVYLTVLDIETLADHTPPSSAIYSLAIEARRHYRRKKDLITIISDSRLLITSVSSSIHQLGYQTLIHHNLKAMALKHKNRTNVQFGLTAGFLVFDHLMQHQLDIVLLAVAAGQPMPQNLHELNAKPEQVSKEKNAVLPSHSKQSPLNSHLLSA